MSVKSKTANTADINGDITANGNNEITGAQLNAILKNLVDSYEDFIGSYTNANMLLIGSPVLRQIVFNTTYAEYYYYNGTAWVPFSNPKYKVYTALLTQTGTSAPVATVLENTIGAIVFGYDQPGTYTLTLSGAFPAAKTWVIINASVAASDFSITFSISRLSDNVLNLSSHTTFNPENDLISGTAIEIRVYY